MTGDICIEYAPESDGLRLLIPTLVGDRTVNLPGDARGCAMLKRILKARYDYRPCEFAQTSPIGTDGSPTQSIIDAWLREGGAVYDRTARAKESARSALGDDADELLDGMDLTI